MKINQIQKNIPTGWVKQNLGDVANFFNGKAHENELSDNGRYVLISSKFVSTNGSVAKYTNKCLSPLKKDDIAMVMSDLPNGKAMAKCFLISEDNKYTLNQRIGGFRSNKMNSAFLYYLLNRNKYFLSFDDGVNQTNLRKDDILACPLLYPSLSEQNRIVSVLETWDKAIEKLAKKIEFKKNIKKGLMQRLLTGKLRLTGFSKSWDFIKLKNICAIQKGKQLNKSAMVSGGTFLALNGGVEASGRTNKWNTDKDTITISEGGNSCGYVNFNKEKFWCGGHCYSVIPNQGFDNLFLYQALKLRQNSIMMMRVGSGLPNIQKKSLDDFKILISTEIKEQVAIANVLTLADNEIDLCKRKLEHLKKQKNYLLSNLITGAIITPETMKIKS